jgi:hypothetical protein
VTFAVLERVAERVACNLAMLLAEPLVGVYVTVPPTAVDPFMKFTVPVGAMPLLWVLTAAVRVTAVPYWTLAALEVSATLVPALVMVIGTVAELGSKLLSPL